MATETSGEEVRRLIAILRDSSVRLHPDLRLCAAEALERFLAEQENWAEGGAAEFIDQLRALGWRPTDDDPLPDCSPDCPSDRSPD